MRAAALAVALLMVACGPNTAGIGGVGGSHGGTGGSGGTGGTGGSGAGTGGSGAGGTGGSAAGQGGGSGQAGGDANGGGDGCPDDAKIVYVVDTNNTFSSFDPMSMTFHDIGQLNCPANGGANPFSMAVSRDAFAYVLYDDGEVFKVSTSDLTCTATSFQASLSFTQFGMGFSSDTAGGTTDTLFIAGGLTVGSSSTLAHVDVGTFAPSPVGNINGWPELTGTGDAKLWGFFPQVDTSGPAPLVAQLDKTNAHFLTMFEADILGGNANDWAFAFWGGSFWIFLKLDTDSSTNVWRMDATNGSTVPALTATGRHIVGAGVSTCAPITIN